LTGNPPSLTCVTVTGLKAGFQCVLNESLLFRIILDDIVAKHSIPELRKVRAATTITADN